MRQDSPMNCRRDLRLAAQAIRSPALQLLAAAGEPSAGSVRAIALQLLCLADDLQDDATGDPEQLVIEPEHVAAGPLIREVLAAVSAMIGGRRRWRIQPAVDNLAFQADRRALQQIFTRVLSNAARFSGDSDCIDLDLEQTEDTFLIRVQDEGYGAALGIGVTTDRRGLGLGLVLSRQLMEAHGGGLAVESAPGVGTCVVLSFPSTLIIMTSR